MPASFIGVVLLSHSALGAEREIVFAPEFIAVHSPQAVAPASVKRTNLVYNLIGTKLADGRVEQNVFKMSEAK
jgi:hypothetical protein